MYSSNDFSEVITPVFKNKKALAEHFAPDIMPEYKLVIVFLPSSGEYRTIINNTSLNTIGGKSADLNIFYNTFLENVFAEDRPSVCELLDIKRLKLLSETSFIKKSEKLNFRYKSPEQKALDWLELTVAAEAITSEYHGAVTISLKFSSEQVEIEHNDEFNRLLSSLIVNSYTAVYEYNEDSSSFIRLISDDGKVRQGFRNSDRFTISQTFLENFAEAHIMPESRTDFINLFSSDSLSEIGYEPKTIECRFIRHISEGYHWFTFTLQRFESDMYNKTFLFVNDVHKIRTRQLENQLSLAKAVKDAKSTVFNQSQLIIESYNNALDVLSSVVEYRSLESGEHIHRIKYYTESLLMAAINIYPEENLTDEKIMSITKASVLHDVGKIGIPDNILLKPGRLTKDEFDVIKKHTIIGAEIADRIKCFGNDLSSIQESNYSYDICRYHHERYDGRGYPDGLKGDSIPFCAQIVAIADVYDALTHERVYKPAFNPNAAQKMIFNGECGIFSPRILQCFEKVKECFTEI